MSKENTRSKRDPRERRNSRKTDTGVGGRVKNFLSYGQKLFAQTSTKILDFQTLKT